MICTTDTKVRIFLLDWVYDFVFGNSNFIVISFSCFVPCKDAGMYDSRTMGISLGVAEKWFILVASTLFCTVFLATCGLLIKDEDERPLIRFGRYVGFWGFFTFNSAIYSYFGQLFVCLVKPTATAFILSSVFIGINNFFSGLVARPQFMAGTFYGKT